MYTVLLAPNERDRETSKDIKFLTIKREASSKDLMAVDEKGRECLLKKEKMLLPDANFDMVRFY